MVAVGFFQHIKGWNSTLAISTCRHYPALTSLSGTPGNVQTIIYPRDVREIYDSGQAGFSYTTSKLRWKYGFRSTIVVDGNNSDNKPWFGGSLEIPFGGKRAE